MLTLLHYTEELSDLWNRSVSESRNGTFLLDRRFMDYHRDRFTDCSMMVMRRDKVMACFPANLDQETHTLYSHEGLTYGGLILNRETTSSQTLSITQQLIAHYRQAYQVQHIVVKQIPWIYHRYPSEDTTYALFRTGFKLMARGLSSAIDLQDAIGYDKSRRRMLRKGEAASLRLYESTSEEDFEDYWSLLNTILQERHGVRPVHSRAEMQLLTGRFPDQIKLYVCRNMEGDLLAGCWLFLCNHTIHTQYMSVSDNGKRTGALDYLVKHLKETYQNDYKYLDFGISTEENGKILNEDLIYQKDGLGGRGICYDIYKADL